MTLIDQINEIGSQHRADQYAKALRDRGCPADMIPSFMADREAEIEYMKLPVVRQWLKKVGDMHECCHDDCLELVPSGVLWCPEHAAMLAKQQRKAVSRWRRFWSWIAEGL